MSIDFMGRRTSRSALLTTSSDSWVINNGVNNINEATNEAADAAGAVRSAYDRGAGFLARAREQDSPEARPGTGRMPTLALSLGQLLEQADAAKQRAIGARGRAWAAQASAQAQPAGVEITAFAAEVRASLVIAEHERDEARRFAADAADLLGEMSVLAEAAGAPVRPSIVTSPDGAKATGDDTTPTRRTKPTDVPAVAPVSTYLVRVTGIPAASVATVRVYALPFVTAPAGGVLQQTQVQGSGAQPTMTVFSVPAAQPGTVFDHAELHVDTPTETRRISLGPMEFIEQGDGSAVATVPWANMSPTSIQPSGGNGGNPAPYEAKDLSEPAGTSTVVVVVVAALALAGAGYLYWQQTRDEDPRENPRRARRGGRRSR